MEKLCSKLTSEINKGIFSEKLMITFSNSYVPGEGEHKFLKHIEHIKLKSDALICIFSNDADLLMLSNRFPNKNIIILMNAHHSVQVFKEIYKDKEYVYINVPRFQHAFVKELDLPNRDKSRVIFDFIFYNMLAGNDFVQPIYFCKMRKSHTYKLLSSIYRSVLKKHNQYLIYFEQNHINKPSINNRFMLDFLLELSNQENFRMKKQHEFMIYYRSRHDDKKIDTIEWTREYERIQHMYYFDQNHPHNLEYKLILDWFRFHKSQEKHIWRDQYYLYFFGFDHTNPKFDIMLNHVCMQYFKSLVFTLHYYLDEIPSWKWYYPYKAAPLPSDLYSFMKEHMTDINDLNNFEKGEPFHPLEQLMCVLPPQNNILPQSYNDLMTSDSIKCYFPTEVKLDMFNGEKLIYAEPILPNIDIDAVLKQMESVSLTQNQTRRNRLELKPLIRKNNPDLFMDSKHDF